MSRLEDFVANSGAEDRAAQSIAAAKLVLQTSQNPPDQAGRDIKLGRQYGVPPGAVALDRSQFQNRATVDASSAALARSPKLADWIASQPVKAEAAQDDVPQLGMVENALTSLKSFAQKVPQRLFNEGWLRLRQQALAVGASSAGGTFFGLMPNDEYGRWAQDRRRQVQAQADTVARENRGDGFVSEAVLQGFSSLPANVPSMLFGGIAGRGAGTFAQATLSALPIGTLVGSDAYQRGLDEGLDNATALRFGATQGAAETVFEFLPALDLFKNLNIGTPLVRTVFNNVVEEFGAEAATQLIQSFDEQVTLTPERPFGEWLRGVPAEMLAAGIGGATGAAVTSPTLYGLDRIAARFDGRDAAVKQAQESQQLLSDMLKMSEASKLRERDPATFAEFVQMAAEDGPADTVFVDANALVETLAQSGIEIDQLQEALPSAVGQLTEAAATGRDVAIPVGEFLAQPELANKLLDQVKVNPAGMTKAEAERFMAERGDELQREVEAAVTQVARDEAQRAGFEAVKAHFEQQFGEVNRFRADVNRSYSSLMAAFFTTMAARANTTPEALLQRFNLRVQAERPTGSAVLDQPTESGYASDDGQDPERPRDRADRAGEGSPPGDPTQAGGLSGSAQLRGGQGPLANEPGAQPGLSGLPAQDALLPGSPAELELPGLGRVAITPHAPARQAAADYMASRGLLYGPPNRYADVDRRRAERIAAEFDKLPIYPETPEAEAETLAAYEAMIEETVAQWRVIEATGLQIEWITDETGDPYKASPRLAILDVQNNNRLFVYPTSAGFGTQNAASEKNPLLRWADFEIGGRRVQMNDVFRIVHDYFGHIKDGHGFRWTGEENAWQSHAAMYTPLARRAMTIETRGQNSWLNFGPHGEHNRTASSEETIYADQKIGLLPEWASEEGMLAHPWSGLTQEEIDGTQAEEAAATGEELAATTGGAGRDTSPAAAASAVGWTPERVDRLIREHGTSFDDRTNAVAVMMSPDEFLGLTASPRGREQIAAETGPLDPQMLRGEEQTPFLVVEALRREPTEWQRSQGITELPISVMGHEGRHRMTALKAAGYTRVPVVIMLAKREEQSPPESATLNPQASRLSPLNNADIPADITGMIPINAANRENLIALGQDAGLLFQRRPSGRTAPSVPTTAPGVSREEIGYGTDTPEFKAWFGGSKVVDAEGRPLVVHHGTGADFDVFDNLAGDAVSAGGEELQIAGVSANFFTSSYSEAEEFADMSALGGAAPRVVSVFLRIERPLVIEAQGRPWTAFAKQVAEAVANPAYDGVILRGVRDSAFDEDPEPTDVYVVARSEQIKAVGNRGTFDPADPVIFNQSPVWQPPFYSSLQKAAREAKQDKGTVEQWKAALSRAPGVKKEELEWTGVLDWLDVLQAEHTGNGQLLITRQQVTDFLDANGIEIEEIVKSENPEWDDDGGGMSDARREEIERDVLDDFETRWADDHWNVGITAYTHDEAKRLLLDEIDRQEAEGDLDEDQAQAAREELVGQIGDEIDYETIDMFTGEPWPRPTPLAGFWVQITRSDEGLVTPQEWAGPDGGSMRQIGEDEYLAGPFPDYESADDYHKRLRQETFDEYRESENDSLMERIDDAIEHEEQYGDNTGGPKFATYITSPGQGEDYTEVLFRLPLGQGANPKKTTGTHWDEEGVVAHARFDTRDGPNGERVMVIHEIQSDWHQKGAKQGYNAELKPAERAALEAQLEQARAEQEKLQTTSAWQMWRERRDTAVREASATSAEYRRLYSALRYNSSIDRGAGGSIADFVDSFFGAAAARSILFSDAWQQFQDFVAANGTDGLGFFIQNLNDENKKLVEDHARASYAQVKTGEEARAAAKNEPHEAALSELRDRIASLNTKLAGTGGIPDAPFKNLGYAQLAVKRLLRWAVEHDYDQVIWINGDQQNGWDSGDAGNWFYNRALINLVNEQLKAFRNKPDAEPELTQEWAAAMEPVSTPIDTTDFDRRIADAEKTLIEMGLEPTLEAALRWTTLNEIDGRAFHNARQDLVRLDTLGHQLSDGAFRADLSEEELAQRKAAAEQIVAVGDAYSFLREKHADKNLYVAGIEKERAKREEQRRLAEAALAEARDEIAAIEKDIADMLAPIEGREELVKAWVKEKKAAQRESRQRSFENLPIPDDIMARFEAAGLRTEFLRNQVASGLYETGVAGGENVFPSGTAIDSITERYTELQTDLEEARLRLTAIQNTVNGRAASAGRVRWIVGVKGMEKDSKPFYPGGREALLAEIEALQENLKDAEEVGDESAVQNYLDRIGMRQDQLAELDAPPRGHMGFDITQAMRDAAMGGFPLFSQQNRGAYSPSQRTIVLLRAADLSTFLHEAGHFFLDVMEELAADPNATAEIKSDFDRIMRWFGTDAATWSRMTLEQKRENHEKWARGFEAYLFTGQAPAVHMTGLFQRFRSWLKAVYKAVANLDVNLSPDIREVMDRMLASEEEIAEAQAARSMAPLFADPATSGMSAEEWREYQAQAQAATDTAEDELSARAMRDMQWLRNARSREIARLQRDAREKRAAVRREVTAEVDAIPAYRAEKFLRRGVLDGQKVEGGFKLSIEEIEALYADRPMLYTNEIRARLAGMVGRANAIHPEQAAELLGFSSADELIQALANAEPRNELIEAETERRMLERYGELTDQQSIEEAADRAVSNQARARFVATELNALSRTVGRPKLLATAAKQFAAQTIARLRIRDIRPSTYEAAERRAAQAAMKALAQGNRTAAAAEKRNQLINLYAGRAAHEAREEMQKALAYFKKFQKAGVEKRVDPEYLDQINGLLSTFDLAPALTNRETDRRKSLLEWIEDQKAKGLEPEIDPALLLAAGRKSWRDMTVEEMRGLRDAVASIEHLGRLKNRLLTARRERNFKAAVEKARLAIQANAFKTNVDKIESNTWLDGVRAGLSDWFAQHRKLASIFRTMDGQQDGGILWELFVRPMNEAGDRETVMREEATIRLLPIFKAIGKKSGLRSKVYIPAIGTSLSYEGRLAVALNYGNEINRQRLYEGDKWTDEQVRAVLGTLTAEDFQIVQTIWREIARYWPMIQEKERRVTGLTLEPAEPSPFVVETADGQTVALDGGYYPIKYDPRRSGKAESDTIAEQIKQQLAGAYTRATTRRGHTKARVDTVERPVRKDLGVITEHLSQVIHDLSWHEWLIDANRLLSALDPVIREHYNPETARALSQTLRDIALGDVPPVNSIEKTVNHLRTGSTIVGMGWSLMTAMLQPFGFSQSVVRIGPKWVGKGLAKIAGDALHLENSAKWVHERSDFMRLRAKTMQREINELRNQVSATPAMWQTVQASFFVLIAKTQLMVDLPTWIGAYEKAMASGQDEPTAAALADQAVIDSQGGGQIKDLAGVQRGGVWLKLWTNFYSYFNVTYNLMAESIAETRRVGPKRLPLLAVDFLLLSIVPATLAELLRVAVSGDEPDEEELADRLIRANLSYMMGMMIGLREVGQVIGFDGGYGGPAGARFLSELSKLRKQAEQGEADEAFWKALNTAGGIIFHYPAGQINRTVSGIDALIDGRTDRIGAIFTGPNAEERAA